jgi:hypothetical protein
MKHTSQILFYISNPLQNLTIGVLRGRGIMSLEVTQDSGPPEPRCEALCQGLHSTEEVIAVL